MAVVTKESFLKKNVQRIIELFHQSLKSETDDELKLYQEHIVTLSGTDPERIKKVRIAIHNYALQEVSRQFREHLNTTLPSDLKEAREYHHKTSDLALFIVQHLESIPDRKIKKFAHNHVLQHDPEIEIKLNKVVLTMLDRRKNDSYKIAGDHKTDKYYLYECHNVRDLINKLRRFSLDTHHMETNEGTHKRKLSERSVKNKLNSEIEHFKKECEVLYQLVEKIEPLTELKRQYIHSKPITLLRNLWAVPVYLFMLSEGHKRYSEDIKDTREKHDIHEWSLRGRFAESWDEELVLWSGFISPRLVEKYIICLFESSKGKEEASAVRLIKEYWAHLEYESCCESVQISVYRDRIHKLGVCDRLADFESIFKQILLENSDDYDHLCELALRMSQHYCELSLTTRRELQDYLKRRFPKVAIKECYKLCSSFKERKEYGKYMAMSLMSLHVECDQSDWRKSLQTVLEKYRSDAEAAHAGGKQPRDEALWKQIEEYKVLPASPENNKSPEENSEAEIKIDRIRPSTTEHLERKRPSVENRAKLAERPSKRHAGSQSEKSPEENPS